MRANSADRGALGLPVLAKLVQYELIRSDSAISSSLALLNPTAEVAKYVLDFGTVSSAIRRSRLSVVEIIDERFVPAEPRL